MTLSWNKPPITFLDENLDMLFASVPTVSR
jgi:hypothetical protein